MVRLFSRIHIRIIVISRFFYKCLAPLDQWGFSHDKLFYSGWNITFCPSIFHYYTSKIAEFANLFNGNTIDEHLKDTLPRLSIDSRDLCLFSIQFETYLTGFFPRNLSDWCQIIFMRQGTYRSLSRSSRRVNIFSGIPRGVFVNLSITQSVTTANKKI